MGRAVAIACGCSKRKQVYAGGETSGYIVILPDGSQVPAAGDAPFFSLPEAKAEVRRAGGGTVKRLVKSG